MRVLVACEYSGRVRDAFLARGHDAMSCDLLPTESPGPHHTGDVLDLLRPGRWDLVIAHPPCNYLTNAGVRWLYTQPDRWRRMLDAADFFKALLNAPAPRVAVENPLMHRYAAAIVGERQTQVVHPWMFGHTEVKATGLWLRGLPPLVGTEDCKAATYALPYYERGKVVAMAPSPDRAKLRALTFQGLADAMAEQWGTDG